MSQGTGRIYTMNKEKTPGESVEIVKKYPFHEKDNKRRKS